MTETNTANDYTCFLSSPFSNRCRIYRIPIYHTWHQSRLTFQKAREVRYLIFAAFLREYSTKEGICRLYFINDVKCCSLGSQLP